MSVFHSGTLAQVRGSIFRGTLHTAAGEHGNGLVAASGGSAALESCLLEGNATAGLLAINSGTTVSLSDSGVFNTLPAGAVADSSETRGYMIFGDGILAAQDSAVELTSTLVVGNSRCGGYFYDGASGTVTGCVISGNMSYGLAIAKDSGAVEWEDGANYIIGNAQELPSGQDTNVTTAPGGLPVPPPPELSEMPTPGG